MRIININEKFAIVGDNAVLNLYYTGGGLIKGEVRRWSTDINKAKQYNAIKNAEYILDIITGLKNENIKS